MNVAKDLVSMEGVSTPLDLSGKTNHFKQTCISTDYPKSYLDANASKAIQVQCVIPASTLAVHLPVKTVASVRNQTASHINAIALKVTSLINLMQGLCPRDHIRTCLMRSLSHESIDPE